MHKRRQVQKSWHPFFSYKNLWIFLFIYLKMFKLCIDLWWEKQLFFIWQIKSSHPDKLFSFVKISVHADMPAKVYRITWSLTYTEHTCAGINRKWIVCSAGCCFFLLQYISSLRTCSNYTRQNLPAQHTQLLETARSAVHHWESKGITWLIPNPIRKCFRHCCLE